MHAASHTARMSKLEEESNEVMYAAKSAHEFLKMRGIGLSYNHSWTCMGYLGEFFLVPRKIEYL